jgi:hypothetical protein
MITKEQIESRIARNKEGIAGLEGREENSFQRELVADWKADNEIYTLALQAIEMQPRPLSEINEERAICIYKDRDGETCCVPLFRNKKGHWLSQSLGLPWDNTYLAIPLSALSKVRHDLSGFGKTLSEETKAALAAVDRATRISP